MKPLREALVQAWYRGAWWLYLLRPVEAVFRGLTALRRGMYRRGVLLAYKAPIPVVVVGNITVGGTGKTPTVIALVESLQQRGIRVGVISRGYGASDLASPHWVRNESTAMQCGDEALVIHRRTNCACVVFPRRVEAAKALLAHDAVDVLISDDGLQHYALARDLEIALIDSERGTGNGFCLPAGPLREPVKRLQAVDYVLYRNGPNPQDAVCYDPVALVNVSSGERRPMIAGALGREVYAVAGLGQPEQFFESLRGLGFQLEAHAFADHHPFAASDFAAMTDKPIIMTEKDAVKCVGLVGNNSWYLEIQAQLPLKVVESVAALAR